MSDVPRMPLVSADPLAERAARLRDLFPDAVAEGRIDFERLKQALGENVATDRERYELSWAGKSEARRILQSPSMGTLAPDRAQSVHFDATENMIIEGDNLEVLKLLQKDYTGRVKMIYIDPPYNTGNEFIYPDNFREGLQDYLRYSGQVKGEQLQSTSTERSGQIHSKWLSMMYPRLFLAKNLLQEDGAIFVSIDDHEVHNLHLLMNEIFGEENFISQITVITNPKGRVLSEHFAECHDYVLVYSRSARDAEFSVIKDSEQIEKDYPDVDKDGRFRTLELRNTHRQFGRFNRKRLYYPLYVQPIDKNSGRVSHDDTGGLIEVLPIWDDGFEGCWTWGESKVKAEGHLLSAKYINGQWKIFRKSYAINSEGQAARKKLKTVWTDAVLHTEKGQSAFDALVSGRIFQSPKSVDLIATSLRLSSTDDDIILDFFGGSGTTGQQ